MQKVKYFMTSPVLAGQGAAKDVGTEAVKLGNNTGTGCILV